MRTRALLFAGVAGVALLATPVQQRSARQPDFFPFAVWYSGGKARAPMLSPLTPASRAEWRHDLQQIKQLGFNTVRTWVEWAEAEPRRGEYHLENLRLLLALAQEVGLRVMVQMYADAAPDWVGKAYPYARFVTQSGVARILHRQPRNSQARRRPLRRRRACRVALSEFLRLGSLE